MAEMLTAKEIQDLLQVDRSTVYRMAEDGRLPALKVGKQWRFPAEELADRFHINLQPAEGAAPAPARSETGGPTPDLAALLPVACVQLIQDSFAAALNTMLVITDMEGNPITEVSNPCGLFTAVSRQPHALRRCIDSWHDLAHLITLEPQLHRSHLGLYCARSLIRVGRELKGMVVTGCIAPPAWPPTAAEVNEMAATFELPVATIQSRLEDVFVLGEAQQQRVLTFLPQVANIVAHIVDERKQLLDRLQAIAALTEI